MTLFDLPRGPLTVPLVVLVPFPLVVVAPLTVVVPPFGPLTVPEPVVPLSVVLALPCAVTFFPRAR